MKKVAIVFLSLIVIVGCNQNAEKQGVSNTPPLFSISDNITIEPIPSTNNTVEIAMVTDKVKTGLDISNYIVNWNDYLKEKFDIDINFKYFGKLQYYDDNWYPTLLSTDIFTYNTGVVFSDNLVPYIKNKIIQPFTDYVVMSEYWSSFPGEFRNSYRDANGDIWAIPYSDHITVFSRAINTDWLNALNIEVPSSTDELYELLHSFTYNDPDDNGKDDTYGVALGGMYLRWLGFKDVFEANGCYLTYQYYFYEDNKIEANVVPVGYNPATNKIEDSVSKPGMKESLNFIASLIDNKIISPDYNYMNDGVFSNNRVGTYMGPVRNNIVYPERYEYVFALQGLMSEYTSSIFQDGGGAYFLSANSKNPSEIVPVFIDTFYGDEAGYEFARFGLLGEKNMYSKHNGVIQTNYPSGSLISNISLVGNLSWQKPNVYEHESDIQKTAIDIDKLLNLKGVYLLTQNQMSFGEKILKPYDGAEISIDTIYNGQISQAYYAFETGQVGVEDTYNELLRIHKLFHVDEWIEEINAKWIGND